MTAKGKPSLRKEPQAWLKRQVKMKLNNAFWRFGLRTTERVEMTALQPNIAARHVIDVGVAFGTPDLYARFLDARLELFEPSPKFRDLISSKILRDRNGCLHEVALGETDGKVTFHMSGPASSSVLGTQEKPDRTFPTIEVEQRRLDSVFRAEDLLRPCLLKIDTEGSELSVLKGAEGILSSIDYIVLELHLRKPYAYQPHELLDFLSKHGFRLADVLDHEVRRDHVVCIDIVMERIPTAA